MNIYGFINNFLNQDSVIFEIGCHMGIDTQKFIQLTNSSKIHCFECDPRNIEILKKRNLNVTLNDVAVSDVDGVSEFYQSTGKPENLFGDALLDVNDWTASSSIKKPKDHLKETPWCKFKDPIEVRTKRIDTYCAENGIEEIDFVWMDVQGAEREVLSGFGKIIEKTKFIFTEYSDRELYEGGAMSKETILNLLGEDWKIVHDFGNDILLINSKK
jgi:FkbM family methyltransferase